MQRAVFLAVPLLLACSTGSVPTETAMVDRSVIVAKMATHDGTVTILGGAPSLRYSVTSTDGTLVADRITGDELRARAPELHRLVMSGVAGAGDQRTYVDATLDAVHRPGEDARGVAGPP